MESLSEHYRKSWGYENFRHIGLLSVRHLNQKDWGFANEILKYLFEENRRLSTKHPIETFNIELE